MSISLQTTQAEPQYPDEYLCVVCFEPKLKAVTLVPCGHTLDEGCAKQILAMRKICPLCSEGIQQAIPAWEMRSLIERAIAQNRTCESKQVEEADQPEASSSRSSSTDHKTESAFAQYILAAGQGNADAQTQLGLLYYHGQGVSRSLWKSQEYFKKAAKQGHPDAQCFLGLMSLDTQGIPQNKSKAKEYFRLAAEQGNAEAQFQLASMYFNNPSKPSRSDGSNGSHEDSYAAARKYFRKAAKQGHAEAQFQLGLMYFHGIGVKHHEKNKALAEKWICLAAKQGHLEAKRHLKQHKEESCVLQ